MMKMTRMDEKGHNKMTPLHYAARSVCLIASYPACLFSILRYGKVDKQKEQLTFREDDAETETTETERQRRVNDMVNISN